MTNEDLLILGRVISKCWEEPEYKENLKANARKVLTEEGYIIRDDVEVVIKEGESGLPYFIGEKEVHFPLPSEPPSVDEIDEPLGSEDLTAVVGGQMFAKLSLGKAANTRHFKVGNWMRVNNQHTRALNCCW